jgi:hypothetical protein
LHGFFRHQLERDVKGGGDNRYLPRYLAGEHEAVWSELVSLEKKKGRDSFTT